MSWRESQSTAMITKCLQAMSLVTCVWASSGCMGSISPTPAGREEFPFQSPELQKSPELAGAIPLALVVQKAQAAGILLAVPYLGRIELGTTIACSPKDSWWDLIRKVEYTADLVYDHRAKTLREPTATHDVDAPDAAGRATAAAGRLSGATREMVVTRFRFVRLGASAAFDEQSLAASGSGHYVDFQALIPGGVKRRWAVASEKSYFEGTKDTNSGRTVDTTRRTENAGVEFDGIAAGLPGGNFRMNALLTVSAFTRELDRSVIEVPIDMDGARGRWLKCFQFRAIAGGVTASLRGMGLRLNASGDNVGVYVRVD